MYKVFLRLWDNQVDELGHVYCYETNKVMDGRYRENTCVYHHILEKSKYPEYALEEWNIVIVHPDTHAQIHSNIYKCPKIKKLTEKLKEEYG